MKKHLSILSLCAAAVAFSAGCGRNSEFVQKHLDPACPERICMLEVVPEEDSGSNPRELRDRAATVLSARLHSLFRCPGKAVSPEGDTRIAVRLPGMTREGLVSVLGILLKPARLEFRVVHEQSDGLVRGLFEARKVPDGYEIISICGQCGGEYWSRTGGQPTPGEQAAVRRFEPIEGCELLLERAKIQGKEYFRPRYVLKNAELTGEHLKSANAARHQIGRNVVDITFDSSGRKIFAKLTADIAPGGARNPDPNGRRHLAIVFDDTICFAPYIRTAIPGGSAIIEGDFSPEEADNLAIMLQSGPLPCALRLLSVTDVAQ